MFAFTPLPSWYGTVKSESDFHWYGGLLFWCCLLFIPFVFLVALEVFGQCCSILLHVENHRPLHPAGEPSVLFAFLWLSSSVLFCINWIHFGSVISLMVFFFLLLKFLEKTEGSRSRQQTETGLHPHLVSIYWNNICFGKVSVARCLIDETYF